MNRIDATFERLRAADRRGLVPYVTAGYPSAAATLPVLEALCVAGADVIELGLPFSDPMADGPVIQRACETALAQGVGVAEVLEIVRRFRQHNDETPIVLMGYLNPVVRHGLEAFAREAAEAGIDGILMVDVPPEEAQSLALLREAGIHQIFLLAPTSSSERIDRVLKHAAGFVYYVALTGITGAGNLATSTVADRVSALRAKTDLPVGVGFGIKTPEHALAVAQEADAVVIGSALVETIGRAEGPQAAAAAARDFLKPFRQALDGLTLERTG